MTDKRDTQADALIGELNRQRAGQLTVFLGAAPGVGKTYAMLARARELARRGVDVLVGIVETHGRRDTAALLDGLTVLPRRTVRYRDRNLQEFDLDALLARRPQLALIDELAHRNAPGSRHERRWQDVVELLDAGIDVHTTVNVQHLESLNDVVQRITGVRVSETVPDLVFDRLRDIVLVDLPPRELIERLKQGKVYVPDQADQALKAYFSPSNLTALRELAMQTAADRVDSDLREARNARGLPGTALRRRIMVAIDGLGQSEYLVRVARRLAERRDAPWTVVTVQPGGALEDARRLELDAAFALARRLGADTATLHGDNIADALLDHAGQAGASALVLGRTRERPLARMFNRTLTQQLLQLGAHYELTIVSTPEARARARRARREPRRWLPRREMAGAVLAAGIATAVAKLAERWLDLSDLSNVFLVAVLLVATRTRMAAAMVAAALCFLAYNFFFIAPHYTLYIDARRGVTTVILFLAAALVVGRLASRLRMQVLALRAANAQATQLQTLSRQLATAADLGQVLRAGREALRRTLGGIDILIAAGGECRPDQGRAGLTGTDQAAADWAMQHGQPAGRFTDTLAGADWWFLPLPLDNDENGIVGLRFSRDVQHLASEHRRLAEGMSEDIAQAVSRVRLVADLEDARVSNETERLRSALLSSVSHDLRSPLSVIIGAASSLDNYAEMMDANDRHELLDTIRVEGERLDRYIQNLLDMTRLGHGELTLNRDWVGVDEVIGSAVARLQRHRPDLRFHASIATDMAPIWVHPALIEQALFNVLENAGKFSPVNEAVTINAREADGTLIIDIGDRGPGIPEAERKRIFDMFYSVERGDRSAQSTGLGLAICQGMIGAHGGSVAALAGEGGRGTTIRVRIPLMTPEAHAAT